jgi:hypothetical protein
MPGEDEADILRKFKAAISGMELADLHDLVGKLTTLGAVSPPPPERHDLRSPKRDDVALYRIRIDLDGSKPPIWRRLDVRSNLTLDIVHQVLQVAFDWTDSHLHRFSLGGGPFDRLSHLFLCPFDVEGAEFDDEGGLPAADVRLDETLHGPGDVLHYLYDYGDSWRLTLRLEAVLPVPAEAPPALVVDGRRAAPPEDCGGITDAEELAEVIEDPTSFDLNGLNEALRDPFLILREYGVDPRLVRLINRLRYSSVGDDLSARVLTLVALPTEPTPDYLKEGLRAHRWFLDRAKGGGITLTSAGYLPPADVEAASLVVPEMGNWIGKNNRESLAYRLLDFRKSLQRMGLLRKYKGTLLLTRAGAAAQRDPRKLWDLLATKLAAPTSGFDSAATLLMLAYAATSADAELPLKQITAALRELDWRHTDGQELQYHELFGLPAYDLLINVSERSAELGGRRRISPAAACLARAALVNIRN